MKKQISCTVIFMIFFVVICTSLPPKERLYVVADMKQTSTNKDSLFKKREIRSQKKVEEVYNMITIRKVVNVKKETLSPLSDVYIAVKNRKNDPTLQMNVWWQADGTALYSTHHTKKVYVLPKHDVSKLKEIVQ